MNDATLEANNSEALSRAHDRSLTPPAEKEPCHICSGMGVIPDTGTEHLFGDPCPEGCDIDRVAIRQRGQG